MLKEKEQKALNSIGLINNIIDNLEICKPSVTKEDLFQQAFIGLINAINSYDKNVNKDFKEYASIYIKYSINEILSKKKCSSIKNNNKSEKLEQSIKVDSLLPYFRQMDIKTVNILRIYFNINDDDININDIAFLYNISTSEINNIVMDGLRQLKYLIETKDTNKTKISTYRKDDNIYLYYSNHLKEDIDRAALLLTDKQREIQLLRFNKETVNKEIKRKYANMVHPRMKFYLEKLENLASWKDAYIEMELEKKEKRNVKTKNNKK